MRRGLCKDSGGRLGFPPMPSAGGSGLSGLPDLRIQPRRAFRGPRAAEPAAVRAARSGIRRAPRPRRRPISAVSAFGRPCPRRTVLSPGRAARPAPARWPTWHSRGRRARRSGSRGRKVRICRAGEAWRAPPCQRRRKARRGQPARELLHGAGIVAAGHAPGGRGLRPLCCRLCLAASASCADRCPSLALANARRYPVPGFSCSPDLHAREVLWRQDARRACRACRKRSAGMRPAGAIFIYFPRRPSA